MPNNGKFLTLNAGVVTEIDAINSSAGAGDASKILKTDASGKIAESLLPASALSGHVRDFTASESLTAGDAVNLWNDTGTVKVQKANATDGTKPAHGFVLQSVTATATVTVYLWDGELTKTSHGLTPAGRVYLSESTPGGLTNTPPSTTGNLVQLLGLVVDANTVSFHHHDGIVIA